MFSSKLKNYVLPFKIKLMKDQYNKADGEAWPYKCSECP